MNECDREILSKGAEAKENSFQSMVIRTLCRVLLDHTSGGQIDFNEAASDKIMQAEADRLDEIHREQSIKEEKKPMKATLLMHETVPSPSGYEWSTWTGGDQIIDISSSSNLAKEVFDWMRDNHLPRKLLRNVHYDGMLFEHTSKPVLAEVGTGIEI